MARARTRRHDLALVLRIATAITDHASDPGVAGLSAEGKITEILAHLINPATGDG